MRKTLVAFYTTLIASALFGVRMLLLGLMTFLQWAMSSPGSSSAVAAAGASGAGAGPGAGPGSGKPRFVN